MTAPHWLADIEKRAGRLPVLLVEGPDDVDFYGHFLGQHAPTWRTRFSLQDAGGKTHVVQGVKVHRPDWAGIVDLDEWTPVELAAAQAASSRLGVLPRFCIESYYCDPGELWAVLPERQRARVGHDPTRLAGPVIAALADWVHHGAMWRVLRALYREHRLPEGLEERPVTDEAEIRRILETWSQRLSADAVLTAYHDELTQAQVLDQVMQLRRYIHGKKFYRQVVLQQLDHLFSGRGAADWEGKFRSQNMPPPDDLTPLLDWALAQFPAAAGGGAP